MFEEQWQSYAKAWSLSAADRDGSLSELVAEDVTYTDPNSEVAGRAEFSAHIGQFQIEVPGAYFEIIEVKAHHGKTLAKWRLCGQGGNEMMRGTSFATVTDAGKFSSFTGFF